MLLTSGCACRREETGGSVSIANKGSAFADYEVSVASAAQPRILKSNGHITTGGGKLLLTANVSTSRYVEL